MDYVAPRLFEVTVKRPESRDSHGRYCRAVTTLPIKAPYGATFGLVETLTRAMATGQITGFSLAVLPPGRIKGVRHRLARWPEALGTIQGVDWTL